MASRLHDRGFLDYRRSDPLALRWLVATPLPFATLTTALHASRQAARKVVSGLVERNYARVVVDDADSRRRNVELTPSGHAYARAVIEVVHVLNDELTASVDASQLVAARHVLTLIQNTFGL